LVAEQVYTMKGMDGEETVTDPDEDGEAWREKPTRTRWMRAKAEDEELGSCCGGGEGEGERMEEERKRREKKRDGGWTEGWMDG
jgi:hypothetical protein